MSTNGFQRATKRQSKARIALDGPSGAGKTWTSLVTATAIAEGGRIAVIDSERGSASKYADRFEFDVLELDGSFSPDLYVSAIRQAAQAGYAVVVVDSLTHAWAGKGGVLEIVDAAKVKFGGNSYMAWSVGTPAWQGLIDAMLSAPLHVIATMRSKSKFVEEDTGGKKSYKRAGTEVVARDGVEFEFDVVGDMDLDHNLVVSKSRAGDRLEVMYRKPGPEFGEALLAWLTDGAVDVKVLARELSATAGEGNTAALKDALAKAKITMDDLADEKKLAKARKVAEDVAKEANLFPPTDAMPGAGDPDNPPAEDERRAELAAALPGQASLDSA